MKFTDILAQANSNLWRNKLRTILTVLAIFIGSFTIILNTAINAGVSSFIDKQLASAGGEGYIEIAPAAMLAQMQSMMGGSGEPKEYSPEQNASDLNYITSDTMQSIRDIPGIIPDSVRPFRNVSVEYITASTTDKKYKINVNEIASNQINIYTTEGRQPRMGNTTPEIALMPGYAAALGFADDAAAVGQQVTLAIKNQVTSSLTDITATITGVQAPSVISMGRSWINDTLNDQIFSVASAGIPAEYAGRVMFATAELDTTADVGEVKKHLEDLKLTGMTIDDSIGMVKTFFDVVLIVFSIFGGIALLAASIGIINTLFMSVQERTREIGLMKAMGLSSAKVFLSFSLEAVMLGLYGSLIGIGLSMVAGFAGNALAHSAGSFLADFPTFQLVEFALPSLLLITLIICFIAFLAGTLPALRAAKKDPIEALRYE